MCTNMYYSTRHHHTIKNKPPKRMQSMTLIVWSKVCVCVHIYVCMNLILSNTYSPHLPAYEASPCGPINGLSYLVASRWIQPMEALVRDVRTRFVHSSGSIPTFTAGWLYPSKGHSMSGILSRNFSF